MWNSSAIDIAPPCKVFIHFYDVTPVSYVHQLFLAFDFREGSLEVQIQHQVLGLGRLLYTKKVNVVAHLHLKKIAHF